MLIVDRIGMAALSDWIGDSLETVDLPLQTERVLSLSSDVESPSFASCLVESLDEVCLAAFTLGETNADADDVVAASSCVSVVSVAFLFLLDSTPLLLAWYLPASMCA